MKPGVSSLNPYAASYVPLSKREVYIRTEHTAKDSTSGNETVWYGHPVNVTQNQHQSKFSIDTVAQGAERHPISEASSLKNHHGSYGSSSSKQTADEEFDMDMEFLQMTFPGLSDQSLTDVYLANKSDLEATIDMLTQLEFDTESCENLPDTLDIGDVSDSGASSECAFLKLKNVVPEVTASSSASTDPVIVS